MQVNGGPITECPICRYNLEGLPRNHRCPECAFEYEETMRVWVATPFYRTFPGLVFGLLAYVFVAALLFLSFRAFGIVIVLYALIWFLITGRKIRPIVVIGRTGITYQFRIGGIKFRTWRQVIRDVGYWMAHDSSDHDALSMFQKNECRQIREEIIRRVEEFDLSSATDSEQIPVPEEPT